MREYNSKQVLGLSLKWLNNHYPLAIFSLKRRFYKHSYTNYKSLANLKITN